MHEFMPAAEFMTYSFAKCARGTNENDFHSDSCCAKAVLTIAVVARRAKYLSGMTSITAGYAAPLKLCGNFAVNGQSPNAGSGVPAAAMESAAKAAIRQAAELA